MSKPWQEMTPEDWAPPPEHEPYDQQAISGDFADWAWDQIAGSYRSEWTLGGDHWELADHETQVHPGRECDHYCSADYILVRKKDGLLMQLDFDVTLYKIDRRKEQENGDRTV